MLRRVVLLGLISLSGLTTGCRSCFLLNPYANVIDDVSDTHVYFDNWYNPRWDISRAGRPDWCGPINSHLGGNICYFGCYDEYDECNLYPPSNPYVYTGSSLGVPKIWTPGEPIPPAPVELPVPAPTPIE